MVTLEASELFKPLSTEDLNSLGAIAHELEFGPGQQIFSEGDTGDGVYMVKEGRVELCTLIGPNSRHIFAQAEPGDIFGEMAVVDAQPRSIGAVASKQTTVYFFPRDEILKLVERSPTLARTLLREISHRLREFNRVLICNATDAMPGGGRVVVRFQSNPEEIVTEIEDSGPGIAPEIAWRLFEEFATHGKAHGTGLGLSICKRIVEDHQGWIRARNQPGGGAVFAFGLPRPKP